MVKCGLVRLHKISSVFRADIMATIGDVQSEVAVTEVTTALGQVIHVTEVATVRITETVTELTTGLNHDANDISLPVSEDSMFDDLLPGPDYAAEDSAGLAFDPRSDRLLGWTLSLLLVIVLSNLDSRRMARLQRFLPAFLQDELCVTDLITFCLTLIFLSGLAGERLGIEWSKVREIYGQAWEHICDHVSHNPLVKNHLWPTEVTEHATLPEISMPPETEAERQDTVPPPPTPLPTPVEEHRQYL